MSRTTGSGKVNKVKMGILIGGVLVLFLIFSTIWDQTHKQPEPQATQETASSADESTSAEESSGTDANASTEPVPDNISVNEMQAKIDELQQQIADKDASITDLNNQVSELQNGVETKGGLTFQEFLDLYFWSDGNTYRLLPDRKLYSDYSCTKEYELNSSDYTFRCNYGLPLKLDNGLTINMVMTTDGQVLWSPDPYFERIDGQCIFREALHTSVCGAFSFVNQK